jgi:HupE / UreJ protein
VRPALALLLLLAWAERAEAHNLALCVLSVREVSQGEFVTHWERLQGVQDAGAANLLLRPLFPEHCRFEPPRLSCGEAGLSGRIGFAGLGELSTSVLLRLAWQHAPAQSFTFSASEPQLRVAAPGRGGAAFSHLAASFTRLGIEHIWLGWDHLAFVLGLLWLVRTPWMLVKTITAFTLAHSLTLGAVTLGVPAPPAAPVEAVIALSIACLAVEVVKQSQQRAAGWSGRAPWLAAFGFGLLHGFGFAGALAELEVARAELPIALFCFNLGVELGQLVFVGGVLLCGWLARRYAMGALQRAAPAAQYALGGVAMYWFFERLAGMVAASL